MILSYKICTDTGKAPLSAGLCHKKMETEKKMDYEFVRDYRDDARLRGSFNRLASRVFGLSFDAFYSRGLWDGSYVCHSFLYRGEIVANVSATKMNLTVNGGTRAAVQLGTVMTAPEHRKKGLAAALMRRTIADCEKSGAFVYLFANDTVLDFYPKFGFRKRGEFVFSGKGTSGGGGLRRLNLADDGDYRLLCGLSQHRRPVSQALGVCNHGIFLFNCLYGFQDKIYYSKNCDAAIIFEHYQNRLDIYDIICKEAIPARELIGQLPACDEIRLLFTPDNGALFTAQPKTGADTTLFIRPGSALELEKFSFPETSHT
jgi:Predicted acetyltransferase